MPEFNKNDVIENYIDDNFWIDFIEDTCNLDITIYLDALYKNIKKALKYINPEIKTRDIDSKTWDKIYLHKKIDYSQPITYKYFKDVICQTYTLANFMHLHMDLYNSISIIEEIFQFPMAPIITCDTKKLLTNLISQKSYLPYDETEINDIYEMIDLQHELKNSWVTKPELSYDYWFWLMIFDEINNCCFKSLYDIKNESNKFRCKFIEAFEEISFEDINEEKQKTEKIPHNKYSPEDLMNWFKCRNIYNACKWQYTILKLITNSIHHNDSIETIKKKSQNINFDEQDIKSLNKSIESLLSLQSNNISFEKYKNHVEDNFTSMYIILFKINNFKSIEEVNDYFKKTSKQKCCLSFVRNTFEFLNNKSDKTILNMISDMEYNIKHKPEVINNLYKTLENKNNNDDRFKNKTIVEISQEIIVNLITQFMSYLQNPNTETLDVITSLLQVIKRASSDIKKSRAKF